MSDSWAHGYPSDECSYARSDLRRWSSADAERLFIAASTYQAYTHIIGFASRCVEAIPYHGVDRRIDLFHPCGRSLDEFDGACLAAVDEGCKADSVERPVFLEGFHQCNLSHVR